MDILTVVRKIILCVGLLVSALLFLYPHWRGSFEYLGVFEYDLGRSFITSPPIPDPNRLRKLIGWDFEDGEKVPTFTLARDVKATYRVHRVRQLTEVALTLLFMFGVVRALGKPKIKRC